VFTTAEFISFIVSDPPMPSWRAYTGTPLGLTSGVKRERVTLCPSPAEEGRFGISPELLHASAVPIHISLVLFRIDNNKLKNNDRPIFFAPFNRFLKALWFRSFKTFNERR